jgi:hypothetical protein
VIMTSQNHGFTVPMTQLPDCLKVTHRSLFDGSLQGIERRDRPAFSFQGHPRRARDRTRPARCFDPFHRADAAPRGSRANAKAHDIHSILILGAGPIVIGQACEFDYSGAQACKALREEGFGSSWSTPTRPRS